MTSRELMMFVLMTLVWGAHFSVMKVSFDGVVDPIFYAAVRMSLVALILLPFLKIHRGQMKRVLIAGVCFGGLNYALMFSGVHYTNASISAMTMELYAPIAMVFSVAFLNERIGLTRILSFVLAIVGVLIIYSAKQNENVAIAPMLGMGLLVAACIVEAVGAITVKKLDGIKPFQLLAWFALVGSLVLWVATIIFETDQLAVLEEGRLWRFLPALAYSVIFASFVGQATYYWLLSRLPVNLLASSTLLTAFLAVIFGVVLLNEPLNWQLLVGGGMTLLGVGIIVMRSGEASPGSAPDAPIIRRNKK